MFCVNNHLELVVEPTHLNKYESNWIISPSKGLTVMVNNKNIFETTT